MRLRVLGTNICIIQGNRNVAAILRENSLSAIPLAAHLLQNAFKLPSHVVQLHFEESKPVQSGVTPMYSKIREINRRFLTGSEGTAFMNRFQDGLIAQIRSLEQKCEATHWEDLAAFFKTDLTKVVLDAICGKELLRLSPDFLDNFWVFNDGLNGFLTHDSKLFGTRSNHARNQSLRAIERWQSEAARNFDPEMIDSDGADPYWGSRFFRERYAMMQGLEGYDTKAMASQELAFLYA